MLMPNDKEIGQELDNRVLSEYVAVEGTSGDYVGKNQWRTLAYQTKSAKSTRQGTYFEGAHVAANDGDLDEHLLRDEGLGNCMHLYRRWAAWPCKPQSAGPSSMVAMLQCPRWRLLTPEKAATIPDARERVNALVASRSAETDESATEGSEGQALEDLAGRGKEAVSRTGVAGEDPGEARPQKGKKPGSKEADAAWTRHLGLQTSTPPAQLALDEKVAKELERAQEAATLAGKKLGVDVPPEHTLVEKIGTLVGGIGASSRSPSPVPTGDPQAPRTLEALAEAMTGLESDDDSLTARRASSKGGAFESPLVRAAEEFSEKRASAQVDDGLAFKRRVVERFAQSMFGPRAVMAAGDDSGAGVGGLDDGLDSGGPTFEDPSAPSLFRDAPQPGAVISTPVLAEQRPGEVMAVGLERIRKVLSALHGDAAASDPRRRVMIFYHEVVFLPSLAARPGTHMSREMETLVAALDHMIEGNVARAGDILFGRYKAMTEALRSDGHWDVAREHEVLPQRSIGIASEEERQRALLIQSRTARFHQQLATVRGQSSSG
jgi:hypothetical protein